MPIWWVRFRDKTGKQVRMTTGTENEREAQDFLRRKLGEDSRDELAPVSAERMRVRDLLALLRTHYENKGKDVRPGALDAWDHRIGHMSAAEIDYGVVEAILNEWRKTGADWPSRDRKHPVRPLSPGSCNGMLQVIKQAFKVGRIRVKGFTCRPEFPPRFAVSAWSERPGTFIAPADFRAILDHLPDQCMRDYCTVAYYTGTRRSQLINTELANVDVETRVIHWRGDQTKTGKPHSLALDGEAWAAIERRWAERNLALGYLFHRRGRRLSVPMVRWHFRRACLAAGLVFGRDTGVVFHDMRHATVTLMGALGIPGEVGAKVTGHSSQLVYGSYAVTNADIQRSALRKLQEHVEAAGGSQGRRPAARADGMSCESRHLTCRTLPGQLGAGLLRGSGVTWRNYARRSPVPLRLSRFSPRSSMSATLATLWVWRSAFPAC